VGAGRLALKMSKCDFGPNTFRPNELIWTTDQALNRVQERYKAGNASLCIQTAAGGGFKGAAGPLVVLVHGASLVYGGFAGALSALSL
jgi:hypothetical protein